MHAPGSHDQDTARILIVDDHPANVMALQEVVKNQGYEVVTASSGSAALRILMRQDFAVILLDVNMPGMDGFEVARLLRDRPRSAGTPIIFVTAVSVNDASVAQGYTLGAVDYIFTPVVPEILRAKVAVFTDLHQKTKKLQRATVHLQALLAEKEVLLKEVHHRVKNNLQIISSLLNLQARDLSDERARTCLQESERRLQAIALVHEGLYAMNDLARVHFHDYLSLLTRQLVDIWAARNVVVSVRAEGVLLPIDVAIPCGLIVNELVTNAVKHAFPNARRGSVHVRATCAPSGQVMIAVEDDGIGLAEKVAVSTERGVSLGLGLVATLCHQLEAHLDIRRHPGTAFELRFLHSRVQVEPD